MEQCIDCGNTITSENKLPFENIKIQRSSGTGYVEIAVKEWLEQWYSPNTPSENLIVCNKCWFED